MNRPLTIAALAACAALLSPRPAHACGGFFGQSVEVASDQEIVVVYRDGEETYIFRPSFCGVAKDFGVILPIPATLSANPTIADGALFDQIDDFTKPQTDQVCYSGCGFGGSMGAAEDGNLRTTVPGSGVDVVQRGRVGDFDYVLLQATTVNAFTDWLDQNGFPHDASGADAYQSYVAKGWYFVAFKVSADANDPPAGKKLCGELGPIQLSFAADGPVVPARIASVNAVAGTTAPTWRVFLVAAGQQKLATGSGFTEVLYFSAALRQSALGQYSQLASLSQDGERLTVLNVKFPSGAVAEDIAFQDDSQPVEFRTRKKVYVDCLGGCTAASGRSADLLVAGAVFGWLLALKRAKKSASGGF